MDRTMSGRSSNPQTPGPELLDFGMLEDLARAQRALGRDAIGRFLTAIRSGEAIPWTELRAALARDDAARLAELAHRARGSLGLYGCIQAARLAQDLLDAAHAGRCDAALLAALEQCVAQSAMALEAWRARG
jgi:HPt (histidine-containing phosphotransfer) domain-containing protein